MKRTLLALLPLAALSLASPAQAWSNNLQYRSTTCQVQRGDIVISRGKCNAGFAYDTAVRVIKYWWPGSGAELSVVGQQGTTFHGDPTCLVNNYTDGDRLIICTTGSTSDLGIIGD